MRTRFAAYLAALAIGVAVLVTGPIASPAAANHANDCTVTAYNRWYYLYKSTWDIYWNRLSSPTAQLPNLQTAMQAGPGGWNEYRSPCPHGASWTQFRVVGERTNTPAVLDGYNVYGWINFSSPPANMDGYCRDSVVSAGGNGRGLTCPFTDAAGRQPTVGNAFEVDVVLNVNPSGGIATWSTDLNAGADIAIVQATMTHEYGHVIASATSSRT